MPQSLACVLVHAVFSTKNREPFIQPDIEKELYPYIATILQTGGSPALTIGGTADHLHILYSLSRTKTIASVIEDIKSDSSKWIKQKGTAYSRFYWQSGYGAFSIGQSSVEALKGYISGQKAHHRKASFQDEFRDLLLKYEIPFDERYVWD
ncbi:MAG TPA: IS200/IS605 family transposase [Planctomycetota bacterium]